MLRAGAKTLTRVIKTSLTKMLFVIVVVVVVAVVFVVDVVVVHYFSRIMCLVVPIGMVQIFLLRK